VVSYHRPGTAEAERIPFEFHHVNVERHPLPFADGTFHVVVFCEVIEHLLMDPVGALLEIRRVLRPEGRLILSTPNVARLENVARLVAGANLYDPYSGYGPYGRHNREFTRHEIFRLLGFAGFESTSSFTADVHPHRAEAFTDGRALAPLVGFRHEDLGQYLFFTATPAHDPLPGRPTSFYRSLPPDQLTPYE
jgi:SAM-dependent methyltransferase